MLRARRKGWPHKGAWFSLGSWGTVINILALVWGGDDHQHRPVDRPGRSGTSGTTCANTWSNPFINTFLKVGGQTLTGLPAIPMFEILVGVVLLVRVVYYLAGRARQDRPERVEADAATGEAMIG